jgi:PAS domain S-box-containing protein
MLRLYSNRRVYLLFLVLIISNFFITGVTVIINFKWTINSLSSELTGIVERQKNLVLGLKEKGLDEQQIIRLIKTMREKYYGVGKTGEFAIAHQVGDSIEYLLSSKKNTHHVIPIKHRFGIPMQSALSGKTGFMREKDYWGTNVYAAYIYVPDLKWGIVAKIPIKEIIVPYFYLAIITFIIATILILISVLLFIKISNPLISKIIESEEHYRSLFDNNHVAMLLVDPENGMIVDANPAACKYYGYSIEEMVSLKIFDINTSPLETIKSNIKLVTNKKNTNFVFKHKLANGEIRDVEVYSETIRLKSRTYLYSLVYDVTDRLLNEQKIEEHQQMLMKQNEEYAALNEEYASINEELRTNEEELQVQNEELTITKDALEKQSLLLNESQWVARLGHYVFDVKTGFWESSETLDDIFGIDNQFTKDVNGWVQIIHPAHQQEMLEHLTKHVMTEHKLFDKEYRIIRISGKQERWVHGMGNLNFNDDGSVKEMFGTIQDITERKIIELQLVEAKEKAEESDRLKTAFLQNMSHEIRTPMNAIVGFSELLLKYYNNRPKLEHFSNIIVQRSNDLLEIINEILDISKIESGQLPVRLEECNIQSLFKELNVFFSEHSKRIKKQHLKFITINGCNPSASTIITDEIKLKQVLINLIGNAFKFTENGTIEAGCKLSPENKIIFYVKDTGIGIPKENQAEIFERFIQVERGKSRLYGGTGLGLPIVKGLLKILGGEIWLESEPGKGSSFYFSIPYNIAATTSSKIDKAAEVRDISNLKGTILLVEDDIYNVEYLKEIFSGTSLKLLHASLGAEAIDMSENQKIDLILMDIRLPDMEGYEAIRKIKNLKPGIKIIAQTAYAAASDMQNAFDAGCDDYLSKPIDIDLLLSKLKYHLSGIK